MTMNRIVLFLLIATFGSLTSFRVSAAEVTVTTGSSTVRQILKFSDQAEPSSVAGDLIVEVHDPANVNVCKGGWIRNTDQQYRDIFQMLNAAKVAGLTIRIAADSNLFWSGSTDRYCYIRYVGVL